MALQPVADPEDRARVGATGVWDAVDASPDLGGKMTSNPSKWLLDITGGRHEITESFLSLDIFSVTFKIFLWGKEEGAIAPIAPPMDPPLCRGQHDEGPCTRHRWDRRVFSLPATARTYMPIHSV